MDNLILPAWIFVILQFLKMVIVTIENVAKPKQNEPIQPVNKLNSAELQDTQAQLTSLKLQFNELLDYTDRLNKRVATRQARGTFDPAPLPQAQPQTPQEVKDQLRRNLRVKV